MHNRVIKGSLLSSALLKIVVLKVLTVVLDFSP